MSFVASLLGAGRPPARAPEEARRWRRPPLRSGNASPLAFGSPPPGEPGSAPSPLHQRAPGFPGAFVVWGGGEERSQGGDTRLGITAGYDRRRRRNVRRRRDVIASGCDDPGSGASRSHLHRSSGPSHSASTPSSGALSRCDGAEREVASRGHRAGCRCRWSAAAGAVSLDLSLN